MNTSLQQELRFIVQTHLQIIYNHDASIDITALTRRLILAMNLDESCFKPGLHENFWDQKDTILIAYGDSIQEEGVPPLESLHQFLNDQFRHTFSGVHILPFFPYSSDDGFSVIDYSQINDALGNWQHIINIAKDFDLMADLVINHCSSRGRWFENFKQRKDPGSRYFIEANPDTDLSAVVRPRTNALLREVDTLDGKKNVWCTFSHDQVDLDFANPEVLCEMIKIINLYLSRGVKIFRLDAVAFLWKEIGTPCINHPKTHEVVRLIRTLIEHHSPDAIIITETNLPNHENLSYFGNANEAHSVYNFSLPPLLLHALTTGTSQHLKMWQMSMPPAQFGTFYFNFLASHDGIGLRPAEGLLSEKEINSVVNTMQTFGARISWRTGDSGTTRPYEINITLFDALQGTTKGPDKWQIDRFICAHAIMLGLEGIPAIYIHSMLATRNNEKGVELTRQNRSINRYKWNREEICALLQDADSHHARVLKRLKCLLAIRKKQAAFHPNATQFTLHLGDELFGYWRQSVKREQSIFCINNVTDREITIPLASINLINLNQWTDLISGLVYDDLHKNLTLIPYQSVWLTNQVNL